MDSEYSYVAVGADDAEKVALLLDGASCQYDCMRVGDAEVFRTTLGADGIEHAFSEFGFDGLWRVVYSDDDSMVDRFHGWDTVLGDMSASDIMGVFDGVFGDPPFEDMPEQDVPEKFKWVDDEFNAIEKEYGNELAQRVANIAFFMADSAYKDGIEEICPIDSDGIPCVVGDRMCHRSESSKIDRTEFTVMAISDDSLFYSLDGSSMPTSSALAETCVHCDERSLEDILRQFANDIICMSEDDSIDYVIERAVAAVEGIQR